MPIQRKRRRRRRHYKTGIHRSPKCRSPIRYRSGWELEVAKYLDNDPNVIEYGYECVVIEYIADNRTGKIRSYLPDFFILYRGGNRKLVEVKRHDKLTDPKVVKKAAAAKIWCEKQKKPTQYEFWTNPTIEAFKKINEAREQVVNPIVPLTLTKQVQKQMRAKKKP